MSRTSQHGLWQSKLSTVLTTTGAAIGLGNIWKFPYMIGTYGGSTFLLIYLICVVIVGLPLMMAEMSLGRLGRRNPLATFRLLAKESGASKRWAWIGTWSHITLLAILSFYSVVAGWSLYYLGLSLTHGLSAQSLAAFKGIWTHYQHSPLKQISTHTLFMLLTMGVVAKGVNAGLEKAARIMLPFLFLCLIILACYGATTPGFKEAWHFLLAFRLDHIHPDVAISALGHAFFTLAVGASALVVYGAYVPTHVSLPNTILTIAGLDVLVAILSGLAIFPLVFTYHLPITSGPGLMFNILPMAFSHIHYGWIFGPIFFTLLLFAAWTSSLSLAEPLVIFMMEEYKKTRRHAAIIIGLAAWSLGLLSALSLNLLKHVQIFDRSIFLFITDTATNVLLPIGGLGIIVFTGYALDKRMLMRAIDLSPKLFAFWHGLMRTLTPLAILVIMINDIHPIGA